MPPSKFPFCPAILLFLSPFFALCGCSSGSSSNGSTGPGTTATTTVLTASATSAASGTSIELTATVAPTAATGTVTYYDGSTSLGSGTLGSGTSKLAVSTLSTGTHTLTATYGGSSTYAGSTSAAVTVTITSTSSTASTACNSLLGTNITASEIGLATSGAMVTATTFVTAGETITNSGGGPGGPGGGTTTNANGEYCLVNASIAPVDSSASPILMEVALPTTWNNKSLQLGGGGTDGSIPDPTGGFVQQLSTVSNPLAQGYAVYGSDSGHPSTAGNGFTSNAEELANFGGLQIKKTHDVAQAIIKLRYGATATRNYFAGGSQGGHEALIAAQWYPADYDGVLAGFPAYDLTLMHHGSNHFVKAIYSDTGYGKGANFTNPTKVAMLVAAVLNACDALDGVADGIVSDVADCDAATAVFATKTASNPLRCANGADTGNTCLSDAQIDMVSRLSSPFDLGFEVDGATADLGTTNGSPTPTYFGANVQGILHTGQDTYPKWPILEGATFLVNTLGSSSTYANGTGGATVFQPAQSDAFQMGPDTFMVNYVVTQNPDLDNVGGTGSVSAGTYVPNYNPVNWQSRIQTVSGILDASNPDLSAFNARGGKMILFHGLADDSITPYNTINYYNAVVGTMTQSVADTFLRFYTIPGMSHGNGVFSATFDGLGALDAWVTAGNAPANLVVTDSNQTSGSQFTVTAAEVGRTRPLCKYPTYPKYSGGGSVNLASSYACASN